MLPEPGNGHSSSKQLAEALSAFLEPLRLNHALELHRADAQVHVRRRDDGLHRQELCFIRLQEAPPPVPAPRKPPARGVRIGGGYYIPEVEQAAAAALARQAARQRERSQPRPWQQQAGVALSPSPSKSSNQLPEGSSDKGGSFATPRASSKRLSEALAAGEALKSPDVVQKSPPPQSPSGPVLLGRPGGICTNNASANSVAMDPSSASRAASPITHVEDQRPSGFAHGQLSRSASSDALATGYHFGTYTRGEARNYLGDRRQCAGKNYEAYLGPAPRGDAAFRVLSSERRRRERLSASSPPHACNGIPVVGTANEPRCHGPGSEALDALLKALGVEPGSFASHDQAHLAPEVQKTECCVGDRWQVELCYVCADRTTEKPVEVIVEKQVEAPCQPQSAVGCQTTPTTWCANCGAPGHGVPDCPLLHLQNKLRQLQLREQQLQRELQQNRGCQLCGAAVHKAADCPLLPRKPRCRDEGVQTEPSCQLCDQHGHDAPKCPMLAAALKGHECTGGQPSKVRVGGGWLLAPEVPGLGKPGLDEKKALQALASANAAGCLGQDGRIVYSDSQSQVRRPRSAPAGGRRCHPSPSSATDATQTVGTSKVRQSQNFAPKGASRFLGAGQLGPERFKKLEQERAILSERIRTGRGKSPEQNRGFIFGTYVPGRQGHCFSSDTGPRNAFRVMRSGITQAATLDPSVLRKNTSATDDNCSIVEPPLPVHEVTADQSSIAQEQDEDEDFTILSSDGEELVEVSNLAVPQSHAENCKPRSWPPRPEIFVAQVDHVCGGKKLNLLVPEPLSGPPSGCPSTRADASHCDTSVCSGLSMDPTSASDISLVSKASSAR
eukprot:TRINITY_DN58077_c0_g1_i1.p1 TRINITY_DN58077_c0_g1~~TRINITY_DN58077_c0_g1_i1.p1  ORF type:complete len:841 (+),score=125.27 TRINITY_DN58077_c0_g1_i1:74-2596(+)